MNRELNVPIDLRQAPRPVHILAISLVVMASVLILLGGLVTSWRAGMTDPLAFTNPDWSLKQAWLTDQLGLRVEHTHRLVGFTLGGLASALAIGAWIAGSGLTRWFGMAATIVLIVGFGQFHGEMNRYEPGQDSFPLPGVVVMGIGLLGVLGTLPFGSRYWRLRTLTTMCLLAVMAQGVLGSFRVKLNDLAGTDLAMFHGIFAQLVFCLLLYTAVFTGPIKPREVPRDESLRLWRAAHWLVIFAFLQLIWGAWLRHMGAPLPQRLHLLTAFLVLASGVWLIRAIWASRAARRRLGGIATFLGLLFVAQIILGVEAWLGKFGPGLPLPELQTPSTSEVLIRSGHTFLGAWVLATSVVMLLRIRRAACPANIEAVGSPSS